MMIETEFDLTILLLCEGNWRASKGLKGLGKTYGKLLIDEILYYFEFSF
jgi:hypothetical protein